MKIKLIKKLVALVFILVTVITSTSLLSSYAAVDNNIDFYFEIPANGKVNKNSKPEFRATKDPKNSWKVNMKDSTESPNGTNTRTMFHLGIKNDYGINPKGSESYSVLEKAGSYYFPAYQSASEKYVYLYGYDNSSYNRPYDVCGYWDEETGKIVN